MGRPSDYGSLLTEGLNEYKVSLETDKYHFWYPTIISEVQYILQYKYSKYNNNMQVVAFNLVQWLKH